MVSVLSHPERNWAGNYTFTAPCIHRVKSVEQIRRLVEKARKVRAIGTRHSFNGIADSSENLIDLEDLDPDFRIDPDRMTVTVGAATSYGALATYLHGQGFALHNMGSLPHISVAGATATSTHGSGDKNGTLSSAVAGLEIVGGDGDLIHVSRGSDDFDGMVVGLGAFGVVTRVTLDIQPTFDVRQDAFVDLPWCQLLSNFDEISAAAYSVSIVTKWSEATVSRLWLKTRLVDGLPLEVTASHLGAAASLEHLTAIGTDDFASTFNPFGGVPGPWSERLSHFRFDKDPGPAEQLQSEYMVPRQNTAAALTALRGIADRIDPCLMATEIRTMAADNLWLSLSYGHDAVGIHFTWKFELAAVDALTRDIEALLIPLGGRPHWGKIIHAPAATLAHLYPRMQHFRNLADYYDPKRKFRNDYLAKHVFE